MKFLHAERGFPGIMVSVRRAVVSRADVVQLFKDADPDATDIFGGKPSTVISAVGQHDDSTYLAEHMREVLASVIPNTISGITDGSPWEVLTSYVERIYSTDAASGHQISMKPEVFRAAYSAIQRFGDQGLSIEEIIDVLDDPGKTMINLVVEVIQSFGIAMEVNGFDAVRIVDSPYCSKYFFSSIVSPFQDKSQGSSTEILLQAHREVGEKNHKTEESTQRKHKITILNSTEEIGVRISDVWCSGLQDEANPEKGCCSEVTLDEGICDYSHSESFIPIPPWINGDGTINWRVCGGLVLWVLGIVMLNPVILEAVYSMNSLIGIDYVSSRALIDDISVVMVLCCIIWTLVKSCRNLLELIVLDKHLVVRKMHQTWCSGIPGILGPLLGNRFRKSKPIFHEHFFANPAELLTVIA